MASTTLPLDQAIIEGIKQDTDKIIIQNLVRQTYLLEQINLKLEK